MRLEEEDGRVARLRSYGFCLETVRALAEVLGQPVRTGIYRTTMEAPGRSDEAG